MADPAAEIARFEELTRSQNRPPTNVSGFSPQAAVDAKEEIAKFESLIGGGSQVNAPPSGVSAVPNLGFQEREARRTPEGEIIPLDFNTPFLTADTEDYQDISSMRTPEDKISVIQRKFPDAKARILDSGDIAVEVTNSATGKPKEVVLNPTGVNSHDLIDLSLQYPEMAAGVVAAVATRGRGILRTTAQILASAFSAQAAGAAKDVYMRGKFSLPIQPEEIARERTKAALTEASLEGVFGVLGKAVKVFSPFAREIKTGSLEFNLQKGIEFFKDRTGIEIKPSAGQKTGHLMLQALEEAEFKQPGARNVAASRAAEKQEQIWKIQDIATGKKRPDEAIGEEAIDTIRDRAVAGFEEALSTARKTAEEKGNKRVLDLIDETMGVPRGERITQSMAGAATREEFQTSLAAADKAVNESYAKVRALPGGSGAVLDGTPAAMEAAKIRSELPEVFKKGKGKGIKSGIPTGLEQALRDLESLKNGKVSLDTLTKMKNAMYDEIAKVEAVPDVTDRWFGKIAAAYEKGIDEAINTTKNPELKSALTEARETYKTKKLPFDKLGVREIARSEFDAGNLSDEAIFNRMFEGPNAIRNYSHLKEVLGATSPAFSKIKRAWADKSLSDVTDRVTKTVDPVRLEAMIKDLETNKPEIAKEIFGKDSSRIFDALRVNQTIKKTGPIEYAELRALMNIKDPTVQDAIEIFKMQERRNAAYTNELVRDIAEGFPISSKMKPSEFSSRLANAKKEDVDLILDTIRRENPTLREAIADTEFYKLLDKASMDEAATASRGFKGDPINISAVKLKQAIGKAGSPERARLETILGKEKMEYAENLINVLAPEEMAKSVFGGVGSFAQAARTLELLKSPLSYAEAYATKALFAIGFTNPTFVKVLSNRMITPERAAMASNIAIASEPIISRMTEMLGPERAEKAIASLKDSLDIWWGQWLNSPQGRESQEIEKMLQGQPARMKLQPTP